MAQATDKQPSVDLGSVLFSKMHVVLRSRPMVHHGALPVQTMVENERSFSQPQLHTEKNYQ